MTVWYVGKCPEHGGWDKRQYGEACPVCTGKLGRKPQPKENEDE